MIPALAAFIPPQQVIAVFERLSDHIQQANGEDAQVLDYFEDTYVGRFRRNGPRGVPLFTVQQEMPRTNNHIEGWHRKFQGICASYHPKFWKFLELLQKEQSINQVAIIQAEAVHPPPAQRRQYLNCNGRILAINDDFANTCNILEVLLITLTLTFKSLNTFFCSC